MPLRRSFSCKCHDGSGGGAIHANLEALDAGIEPTWHSVWLVVEAGASALMTVWKSFEASVIGPGHVATGKPNQDAWAAFHRVWGDGIIVSDGLSSKPFSDFGSHAACLAVACAVHACRSRTGKGHAFLSDRIKNNWLSTIAPLEPRDCAATCLFAFRMDDGVVRMGMLGDDLTAAVKTDGSVVSLTDDKTEGFSNITAALSPNNCAFVA